MQANQLFVEDLIKVTGPGNMLLLGEQQPLQHLLHAKGNRAVSAVWIDDALKFAVADPIPVEPPLLSVVVSGGVLFDCAEPEKLFHAFYALHPRFVVLRFETNSAIFEHPQMHKESFWSQALIEAGFRRCLASYQTGEYARCNDPAVPSVQYFEIVEPSALGNWPLAKMRSVFGTKLDMSREFSPRSDAHLVRYALAAEWIRPGDAVLDCACGLGYGSALLSARSAGRSFTAVDKDQTAIDYARVHFADRYGVEYIRSPEGQLTAIPDQSIDTVVSFQTVEYAPDLDFMLRQFARVLKPDGRLLVSVSNLWADEVDAGADSRHVHGYDYKKISEAIGRYFVIEARYNQETQGGVKFPDGPRSLQQLSLSVDEPDTEWWVLVATANPFMEATTRYQHPQFSTEEKLPAVADFGLYYENPWLYRVMVQMGERVRDQDVLREIALAVLQQSPPQSADFGAALCVLGYQILQREDRENAAELLNLASDYLSISADQPHVLRWQVSISYVGALLSSLTGMREQAAAYFDITRRFDVTEFSPLLATKVIAASFWRGIMHLVDNETEPARQCFQDGVASARKALHTDDFAAIGDPKAPLSFGFQELAEVADMASQCANALHWLHKFPAAPGFFWQKIDTRRFGLATWLLHLENENRNLSKRLS